jgi:transposase
MFLKRLSRKKCGKEHIYWALMRSERTAKGPRHKLVTYLGELKSGELSGWAQLGQQFGGQLDGQPDGRSGGQPNTQHRPSPSLFDVPCRDSLPADETVRIKLKGVRLERVRDFGDVWLAHGLWRMLELDTTLAALMSSRHEDIPWATVAEVLTIARLCAPGSELSIEQRWYPGTALDDILGAPVEKMHSDRLYAGMDKLLPHKEAMEKHIKDKLTGLFDLKFDVLLYDITSTCFEGQAKGNTMAKRGHSRDHRPDCAQVCIGLVATPDGIPLAHEVFDGNTSDSKTVQRIVEAMETRYGKAGRIFVMDRGMVSADNLEYIKSHGGQYLVGTPKAMLPRFEKHMDKLDWRAVHEGVEVKLVPCPDGTTETFVLAKSRDRTQKEKAMNERFVARMEEGLTKLAAAAEAGRLKDVATAGQRLGRLKERNWRASGAFDVSIEPVDTASSSATEAASPTGASDKGKKEKGKPNKASGKAMITVKWEKNKAWSDWKAMSEGCYLLRTNMTGKDPQDLWRQYTQLTEVEAAFRTIKDELDIRPIWHHNARRVRTHILICFLAYVLWKALAQWMKKSGLGDAPRTVLDELKRIKSGDVVLPAARESGPDRLIRLRCVMEMEEPQRVLLNRLGVNLPKRLRCQEELTAPLEVSLTL